MLASVLHQLSRHTARTNTPSHRSSSYRRPSCQRYSIPQRCIRMPSTSTIASSASTSTPSSPQSHAAPRPGRRTTTRIMARPRPGMSRPWAPSVGASTMVCSPSVRPRRQTHPPGRHVCRREQIPVRPSGLHPPHPDAESAGPAGPDHQTRRRGRLARQAREKSRDVRPGCRRERPSRHRCGRRLAQGRRGRGRQAIPRLHYPAHEGCRGALARVTLPIGQVKPPHRSTTFCIVSMGSPKRRSRG